MVHPQEFVSSSWKFDISLYGTAEFLPQSAVSKGFNFDCSVLLQSRVRDSRAGYIQSLEVLKAAKECGVFTKSSLMLGLGEQDDEVIDAMLDLRDAGEDPLLSKASPNSISQDVQTLPEVGGTE